MRNLYSSRVRFAAAIERWRCGALGKFPGLPRGDGSRLKLSAEVRPIRMELWYTIVRQFNTTLRSTHCWLGGNLESSN